MKFSSYGRFVAAALLVLSFFAKPGAALATDFALIVEPSPPAGSTTNFASIQDALIQAQTDLTANPTGNTVTITVKPGTYTGSFTPISNVPIFGTSTAETFIAGSGTVVNLSGVSNVTLRNFTFQTGTTAIDISNSGTSGTVTIENIVFNLGKAATAIKIANSNVDIINNTFYNNATAISITSASTIRVINDLFANNTTAIVSPVVPSTLTYNAFYNGAKGITVTDPNSLPNTQHPGLDPLFVNPPADLHLQATSPCRNTGNTTILNRDGTRSDIGAYGGPNADIPGPPVVTGVGHTFTSPNIINVSWSPTSDSTVTAYRVYYGTSSRNYTGTQAAEGNSPISVTVPTTQATLTVSGLTVPTTAPAAPVVTSIVPLDKALQVTWTESDPAANRFRIYYSTSNFTGTSLPAKFVDVTGNATRSFTLSGLTNGTTYFVAVAATTDVNVFFAVTAVKDNSQASAPGTPNESSLSLEDHVLLGSSPQSAISSVGHDFPEAISPFPDVKGGGCFIATAAYGFYSAPEVQALRLFRDRFLMTNAPGRAFVAWYYRHGPVAARYLNAHPWLKVPVRVVLFPLVVLSAFLVYTTPALKIAILIAAVLAGCLLYRRTETVFTVRARRLS